MYGTIPDKIPVEPAFLLVYAAATNGQVIKINMLGGTSISAGGKGFMADGSPREQTRWKEALEYLIRVGWVKNVSRKGEIFEDRYRIQNCGHAKRRNAD